MQSPAAQMPIDLAEVKQNRLIKAGTSVFVRYGYLDTSLNQIADAALLPRAVVLELAPGKNRVFAAVVESLYEEGLANAKAAEALARRYRVSSVELLTSIWVARVGTCTDTVYGSPHAPELHAAKEEICGVEMIEHNMRFRSWLIGVIDEEIGIGRMQVRPSVGTAVIADELIEAGREMWKTHSGLKWTDLHRRLAVKVKTILESFEP